MNRREFVKKSMGCALMLALPPIPIESKPYFEVKDEGYGAWFLVGDTIEFMGNIKTFQPIIEIDRMTIDGNIITIHTK